MSDPLGPTDPAARRASDAQVALCDDQHEHAGHRAYRAFDCPGRTKCPDPFHTELSPRPGYTACPTCGAPYGYVNDPAAAAPAPQPATPLEVELLAKVIHEKIMLPGHKFPRSPWKDACTETAELLAAEYARLAERAAPETGR